MLNSLNHFTAASRIFDLDREMASFRSITGEEEAASCFLLALRIRQYSDARKLNPKNHLHKNAAIACMIALAAQLQPILAQFQLLFDFRNCRIDLKIPLSNFGVRGGETFAMQPVEPLDMLHSRKGVDENDVYLEALQRLAEGTEFDDIKKLVSDRANQRNTLLYASLDGMPHSRATLDGIESRRARSLALLVITVMILQSRKKLASVRQTVPALISIISRLPSAENR